MIPPALVLPPFAPPELAQRDICPTVTMMSPAFLTTFVQTGILVTVALHHGGNNVVLALMVVGEKL